MHFVSQTIEFAIYMAMTSATARTPSPGNELRDRLDLPALCLAPDSVSADSFLGEVSVSGCARLPGVPATGHTIYVHFLGPDRIVAIALKQLRELAKDWVKK